MNFRTWKCKGILLKFSTAFLLSILNFPTRAYIVSRSTLFRREKLACLYPRDDVLVSHVNVSMTLKKKKKKHRKLCRLSCLQLFKVIISRNFSNNAPISYVVGVQTVNCCLVLLCFSPPLQKVGNVYLLHLI